ncbi:MAG: type II toxin-antitoxin system death-on-curing family toxin [Myxococcota bacterium]
MTGSTTVFPTLEEALFLHQQILEAFGGRPGTRDLGLLESALARPRSGYYDTLSAQAAALMHSLARNHAFVDGNERMAFAMTAVFLRLNGYSLDVTADDAESFLIDEVIRGHAELEVIVERLETWMVPAAASPSGR